MIQALAAYTNNKCCRLSEINQTLQLKKDKAHTNKIETTIKTEQKQESKPDTGYNKLTGEEIIINEWTTPLSYSYHSSTIRLQGISKYRKYHSQSK